MVSASTIAVDVGLLMAVSSGVAPDWLRVLHIRLDLPQS
jgi:hypothetical protein